MVGAFRILETGEEPKAARVFKLESPDDMATLRKQLSTAIREAQEELEDGSETLGEGGVKAHSVSIPVVIAALQQCRAELGEAESGEGYGENPWSSLTTEHGVASIYARHLRNESL